MNQPAWTPNLVIPGVAKCGTTTIYELLAAHPRVTGGLDKEVRFLMDEGDDLATTHNVRDRGLEGWAERFADRGRGDFDLWMDASPQYQFQRIARDTIAELPTKPKVLFVVRDPARRLFSMYQYARYHQRRLPQVTSFADFISAIRPPAHAYIADQRMLANAWANSRYDASIADWRAILPPAHLKIVWIEHLARDREDFLVDLAAWLEIDPAPLLESETERTNETVVTRSKLVRRLGGRLARLLPESPAVRRLKDAVKAANSGAIDSSEYTANARLLADLRQEFAESTTNTETLRRELDAEIARSLR